MLVVDLVAEILQHRGAFLLRNVKNLLARLFVQLLRNKDESSAGSRISMRLY